MAGQTRVCESPHQTSDCENIATDTRFVLAQRLPSADQTRIEETYRQVYVCDKHRDSGLSVPPEGPGVTVTRTLDTVDTDGPTVACMRCKNPRDECFCSSPSFTEMEQCAECSEYTELDHLQASDGVHKCPKCINSYL